ncbi:hypothetical protein SAMN04488074_106282 [Lentzea albidocapillata subsp. violacea]|uniref:Uncharacterized protein n=1 Tax=Lentzea albidocapillata subsp. violacea TaxID=128104 RepID=A0A1G9DIZ7_9PSEU|nr:hypothetical protein [Lentzea albidocapillata]SDK63796.1 hypothetical protein SAMN04488074_106282 [Lentzea albidocapillata subsp. violacea]
MIIENWSDTCLARADRRAVGHILFALAVLGVVFFIGWLWLIVLSVPVVLELAAPGLRHFLTRRGTLELIERFPWRPVSVSFVAGRRIGRQAYLRVEDSEKHLRLPELPERARVLVRHTRRMWIAGPDERGRVVAMTRGLAFLTRGRVIDR